MIDKVENKQRTKCGLLLMKKTQKSIFPKFIDYKTIRFEKNLRPLNCPETYRIKKKWRKQ